MHIRLLIGHGLALSAAITCALACLACSGDECEEGSSRCDGNTAATCAAIFTGNELDTRAQWRRLPCGDDQCTVVSTITPVSPAAGQEAICALAAAPDARCPPPASPTPVNVCVTDERGRSSVLTCRYGHAVAETTCASEETCVTFTSPTDRACFGQAFCAATTARDPQCAGGVSSTCEGDLIVTCACGVRREAHPCQSPGPSCVILGGGATTMQYAGCR